jgi:hypothetical protein
LGHNNNIRQIHVNIQRRVIRIRLGQAGVGRNGFQSTEISKGLVKRVMAGNSFNALPKAKKAHSTHLELRIRMTGGRSDSLS